MDSDTEINKEILGHDNFSIKRDILESRNDCPFLFDSNSLKIINKAFSGSLLLFDFS